VRTARAKFAASIFEFGRWLFCHRVRMPFVDRKTAAAFAVATLLGASPALAQTLPTGGSVASGGVSISQPNTTTLNVNQSTNQAIINWNTFSVGRGDTVNFNQPGASSSTLNRVTSSTPSWIAGTINAPGTVLLVNPNGIEITKSGVVNTGSFAASTLNIKDSDYLSGHYTFSGNGASAGVINTTAASMSRTAASPRCSAGRSATTASSPPGSALWRSAPAKWRRSIYPATASSRSRYRPASSAIWSTPTAR
jgi:filamentous hemagglutinin family protein